MTLKVTVRARLRVSRDLLERKPNAPRNVLTIAGDVIVSHEAAVLALTAICDQMECLPHKSRVSLPDYLECLRKLNPAKLTADAVEFFLDLHKTRVDVQNRAIQPEPQRWERAQEASLRSSSDFAVNC